MSVKLSVSLWHKINFATADLACVESKRQHYFVLLYNEKENTLSYRKMLVAKLLKAHSIPTGKVSVAQSHAAVDEKD